MELPAVRPPRLSWPRRFLTQIITPPQQLQCDDSYYCRRSMPTMPSTSTMSSDCSSTTPPHKTPACPLAAMSASAATSAASSVTSSTNNSPPASSSSSSRHRRRSNHSHYGTVRHALSHSLLQHLHRGSSATAATKPPSHKLSLPHTITERHGGKDLWVTAPVLSETLEKQGFRWRKKWKSRFVELNGRILSYYEIPPTSGKRTAAATPRKSVHITANAHIVDVDERTFSLTPNPGEKPWVFRTCDARTKLKWCKALHDCIDILIWLQHYEMGDVLGVGGNGVVRTLVDKRTGKKFAVKIVDASKFKNRAAVVSEVEILRNITNDIKHPNLVRIHKVYEEQEKIYMILDLCEGGELYDAIVQRGCYGERDAAQLMAQLMAAVDALHQHNILHLDLKPENILLSSKNPADAKIVLTDFGLARMIHGKENPLEAGKTMAGTIGYIAPEVIAAHHYSEAADVFSAGVILFILLVGYPPFAGDSEVEILLKIARGDFQFHAADWSHISTPAKELVARMLEVRAQDRITVKEVLQHPWILEHCRATSGDHSTTNARELRQTVQRMQQFNFLRKSENMASCMVSMLADESEADYLALVNVEAMETLIRQLTPSGSDQLEVDKALVLSRHLGLSPYVNVHSFVGFLDRNQDGFIDAEDFVEGVKAMRDGHESFAKIIFTALLDMVGETHGTTATLTIQHFEFAFAKLQCPEPLSKDFFRFLREHPEESASESTSDDHVHDHDHDHHHDHQHHHRVDEAAFIRLFKKFRFLAMLFVLKAKSNMMLIAKSGSMDDLTQITEEIRESLSVE